MTDSPEAPDSCQRISLKIGGMTCAACAANVQKALSKVEGVSEAAVNIATEQAAVLYDPEKAAKSQLEQAVKDAGYYVIDRAMSAELERINKEIEKAQNGLRIVEQKLSNEKFVSRAPEAVVNAEREKAAKFQELIVKLQESAKAMRA